jgi:uncharacterized protein (TIGR02118 family)
MHKLVILIEALDEWTALDETWPQFLHLVESLPELRREATSRVQHHLYGKPAFGLMHELFFDSLEQARKALASPAGSTAGQLLQQMTGGRMVLYFADHQEDAAENLRQEA